MILFHFKPMLFAENLFIFRTWDSKLTKSICMLEKTLSYVKTTTYKQ
jgi:hypothetical protein